ncbi:MAG: DNA topoisomerase I [Candidatus Jacksonbacteria bacterium RIFOXYC2_FULL_44_29]|nr:MAG: topoisomerase protein [Parcubacteria group bacterium GW2011_GWC2_44_22]OGY76895.1 MAG: DNA topoisomerase I [Candidatus Jacksonbacteria bacterium RIFOXYA2_FULL_43_12]OGY77346.1 MAG: DNA topoisomerase I [Candidatus Jacksonbacteria bacterium RIFOXYB2_FULL_44_15]OGY79562.1 MAG: DNA topoisomerase I [Candidatus Jacksonbacteria bacterium RIFOXYC2_FULL_44_29]OGY82281.1 MAG: DNA topoisomerase I [Candidatus Jacksonbacteria bacterium RIFOXYD2_FULL_43_21]HBH45740.1 type I DNA topoisomerase [Candid
MNLVIVESPTKAKTIANFIDKNYKIVSSFGHVRDLPKSSLGIDVDDNFKPTYVVLTKAKEKIEKIVELAKKAKTIFYATDEDREGEAISWHLDQLLQKKYKIKAKSGRIAFHEITKDAILQALKNPREIDISLVDAQQTRRILDRLVGYKLSPFLWQKIRRGLSAGRVQSVAVKLIVEREKEITSFKPQEYWTIDGLFAKENEPDKLTANLNKLNQNKINKFDLASTDQVAKICEQLKKLNFRVLQTEEKDSQKTPYPPYRTSTLQQDAYNKLGFSSKQTMLIAQQLYEGLKLGDRGSIGLITYMRTDSLNLSNKFIVQTQQYLKQQLGADYSFTTPRAFKNKSKGAQEAHEAIRPTDVELEPETVKNFLESKQYKLYRLIWQRAVASLMPKAVLTHQIIDIIGQTQAKSDNNSENISEAIFRNQSTRVKFDGFLKIYPLKIEENTQSRFKINDPLSLEKVDDAQHFTEPPPRYNDASLVKELEKKGIGRPSTYAPIIDTIQKRQYVEKDENKRFRPTDIGELVTQLLQEHFSQIVDYNFTAKMENDLDEIAENNKPWVDTVKAFYEPFAKILAAKYQEVTKIEIVNEETDKLCPACKQVNLVIKRGRFGKFLACPKFPECKHTEPLNNTSAGSANDATAPELIAPSCEDCKTLMILKEGRFGKFWACPRYPECKNTKTIEMKINLACPLCQTGEVIIKKTKKGKIFYGCNRYPQCKFASWDNPTKTPAAKQTDSQS